jgi:SAM-dependent MidA family methyltransferase
MELALYAQKLGYYSAGTRKFGMHGDFITRPEISPMFARCLSMQARQVLRTTGGHVLEIGPGSGILAADLFAEAQGAGPAAVEILLLEVSPTCATGNASPLRALPQDFHRFVWLDSSRTRSAAS